MFDPKRFFTGFTLAGALVLAGCAREPERAKVDPEKTTPTVSEQEREGTESPSDVAPATARLRVSDLKVGTRFDADTGAVAENLDEVLPGMVDPWKQLHDVNDVLTGVKHILAELIAERADIRGSIRAFLWAR